MTASSRFAGLSRGRALTVLLLLLAVIALTVMPRPKPTPGPAPVASSPSASPARRDEDLALYNAITARVARGEPYYHSAADELRKGNYPLRPFVTFRLPTLAVIGTTLGEAGTRALLGLIMLATLAAWYRQLEGAFADPGRRWTALLLLATGMTIAARPEYAVLHEVWAGLLLTLSLGLHSPARWAPSVAVALAAVMIRELALPFLLLMGAFALFGRRWAEVGGWALATLLFAGVLALHAQQIALVVTAADPASPGWLTVGGWPAFVRSMTETSALRVFPALIAGPLVVLALFGWTSWRSRTGLFGALLLGGYAIILGILGRPENFYWGLIVSPLLLMGLAFLPQAFRDLLDSAKR